MRYSFFILAGIFLLFTSCFRDDLKNVKVPVWNPNVAVPLVNSQFTLEDIIADFKGENNLVTDSSGLVTLIINRDRVFSIPAHEFFQVPEQHFSSTDTAQLIEFVFPGGELIHTLGIKEGLLIINMSSDLTEDVQVNIKIPKATINGVPLEEEILLPSDTNITDTIDLSGYTLDLTGDGADANVIEIQYNAQTLSDHLPAILDEFSGSLQNISFNYADGFFGLKNFEINTDTIPIQFLKNWVGGTIYINDPEFNITLNNDFGIPFFLELSNFQAENTAITIPVSGAVLEDKVTVNFPQDTTSGPVVTDMIINGENSNIDNVIAFSPNKITYKLLLGVNSTLGNAPLSYLYDTSELFADAQLKLPFQGRIENLVLQDTFDLDIDTIKELTHANFKLTVSNSFPVNAKMQVFFADPNHELMDSLLHSPENIIASAITNQDGEVDAPTQQITFIKFGPDKLQNLFSARKLIVRALLSAGNTQQPPIKLKSSYRIDLNLGVIAGVTRK